LELEPKHARALGNIPHYQKTIQEEQAKEKRHQRGVIILMYLLKYLYLIDTHYRKN
jgi:hypothetical protein